MTRPVVDEEALRDCLVAEQDTYEDELRALHDVNRWGFSRFVSDRAEQLVKLERRAELSAGVERLADTTDDAGRRTGLGEALAEVHDRTLQEAIRSPARHNSSSETVNVVERWRDEASRKWIADYDPQMRFGWSSVSAKFAEPEPEPDPAAGFSVG